jgi:hypothetical protein
MGMGWNFPTGFFLRQILPSSTAILQQPMATLPTRSSALFFCGSAAQPLPHLSRNSPYRPVQLSRVGRGTLIPSPQATFSIVGRHVQGTELQMPIFFLHTHTDDGLGLIRGRCHTLLNSESSAPLGRQTTTHIRIGVSEHFLSGLATGRNPRRNGPGQYRCSLQVLYRQGQVIV